MERFVIELLVESKMAKTDKNHIGKEVLRAIVERCSPLEFEITGFLYRKEKESTDTK